MRHLLVTYAVRECKEIMLHVVFALQYSAYCSFCIADLRLNIDS